MQPDRPLLTIAIPTYNRAHFLERLLAVLMKQLLGESRVELIISDNASCDATSEVVTSFKNRGLAIRYIRNETNVGADRNILQCYQLAKGKYVWIFSDDDLIAPGTLDRVLRALSSKEYDLVCIRAYFFDGEYVGHRRFAPVADLEFTKPDALARHVHVLFTFISGSIVNKERLSSVAHAPFESLLDTNLIQLGLYYTALNHHRRSLLIRDPLIAATGNSTVGYGIYRVFGSNLARITMEWVSEKPVQRAIINGTIRKFLPFWILATRRSRESHPSEDAHQILQICFGYNFRYWIFDYPIYALPLILAKIWLLGVRVINKADNYFENALVRS